MMNIKLLVQARDNNMIEYEISENIITATINGITDTFDFTGLPDGKLETYDENGKSFIETTLPEVPIWNAKKVDGELTVEILFTVSLYENDQRLLFPKPMTVEEFNILMEEVGTNGENEMEDAGTD